MGKEEVRENMRQTFLQQAGGWETKTQSSCNRQDTGKIPPHWKPLMEHCASLQGSIEPRLRGGIVFSRILTSLPPAFLSVEFGVLSQVLEPKEAMY